MNVSKLLLTGMLAVSPAAASGEVKSTGPAGFAIEATVTVPLPPAQAYELLGRIGEWWNAAHSYSGEGANLRLGLKAGDCFCERLDDGGTVEHMRVVFARPGQTLRLQGGLGPLQAEGVAGSLSWTLKAVPGGTQVTQSYVVGGYIRAGADRFAPAVDRVMSEQLERFGKFAAASKPAQ